MRRFATRILFGLGCALSPSPLFATSIAHTNQQSAQAIADTLGRRTFDIAAQPLGQALEIFARQSGMRVWADSGIMDGVWSRSVRGSYTAAEALRLLVAGTGLAPHFSSKQVALLRRTLEVERSTTSLEPVHVVASRAGRTRYTASGTLAATKTETALRDVPQSVTVVTRELMRDQSMQSIADVVRYVPGIIMGQGEGNRDQPTIRGNATTADFFVDGVRDDVQYYRDLYNLDRVEALKGSNAMIFGRGGGGGVINRVVKVPQWTPLREIMLQGGSYDNKRVSADVGEAFGAGLATRFNGLYERSGLFRNGVSLRRYGINPTVTIASDSQNTRLTLGYELFADHRTADRGIPSFQGGPIHTDVATFFGNPDVSYADVRAHSASATIAHQISRAVGLRNSSRLASYDKIYQNVFPGAVNATGDEVSISAYNNATRRQNLFNQTDLTATLSTGAIGHTLLVGSEVGRQRTDNFRNTGYFDGGAPSISVPVGSPTVFAPVIFRQSATDADNHVETTVASFYAQDQIALSGTLQLIAGARYEAFGIRYHNNRTDSTLRRVDQMISPRLGVVVKPAETVSLYGSYSVSYLPSAGDQFSSLTDVTRGLEPERFRNYEIGAKWDVAERLSLTSAAYRLDRTNTRALDPRDPTHTVQTGRQRTRGVELGVSGNITPAWGVAGGYAVQDARITSTTAAAPAGARVPLVPRTTLSLWNRFQFVRKFGVGLGIVHRTDMYAAIDNRVTLPGFTEVDAAFYGALGERVGAQLNVENLLDTRYFVSANGNNNISPGSPRALRLSLTMAF